MTPGSNISNDMASRRKLFAAKELQDLSLGIGIVTYNRPAALARCVEHVLSRTKHTFDLVVADDGSTEETVAVLSPFANRLSHLRCINRGVNFNKNRLLFYFAHVKKYDIILILEDDSFPEVDGWEANWIAGSQKYGHINNAGMWFASSFLSGDGSVTDPYRSPDVSAQCVGFSREAIEYVGFIDPALENYGGGHAEHTYRMTKAGYGGDFLRNEIGLGIPNFYLIHGDIGVGYEVTGYPTGDQEGLQRYYALRDGPIYRHAWRTDAEQEALWAELTTIA